MTRRRLITVSATVLLATGLLLAGALPAAACPPLTPDCTYDVQRNAWFAGRVVQQFGWLPPPAGSGPTEPSPDRPDVTVYLIGHVNPTPFAPGGPLPGGGSVPDHDHTWTQYTVAVSDAFGHFVVPGPNATAGTVRTRPMPPGSIAGAPLAYAIKLGDQWYDLTSAPIILQGVDRGLLRTVDAGFGGAGWIE